MLGMFFFRIQRNNNNNRTQNKLRTFTALKVNCSMHGLGLTTRLTREIIRVSSWHVVPRQMLHANVHEVNPRVKVNHRLANP